MIQIGEFQILTVKKKVEHGVYLNTQEGQQDDVLLPRKQVPEEIEVMDPIEVFVYRDSKDRPIATIQKPLITLGRLAVLQVTEVNNIGAFLDWGLEKDLLLPFGEQTCKVKEGQSYLVSMYLDKSGRLCATMKVYEYLETTDKYGQDDAVSAVIYHIHPEIGIFLAVDNRYHGLVSAQEMTRKYRIGEPVTGRVVKVRDDGKLNISLKEKVHIQMSKDAAVIFHKLEQRGGFLPYNDKSDVDAINAEFAMSKAAFKRAVGNLLKAGKIKITKQGIEKARME